MINRLTVINTLTDYGRYRGSNVVFSTILETPKAILMPSCVGPCLSLGLHWCCKEGWPVVWSFIQPCLDLWWDSGSDQWPLVRLMCVRNQNDRYIHKTVYYRYKKIIKEQVYIYISSQITWFLSSQFTKAPTSHYSFTWTFSLISIYEGPIV